MGEHDYFGDTERTAGEQLECPALFRAEMMFSRGRRHPELLSVAAHYFSTDRGGFGAGGYVRIARQLWRSTVTYVKSVKIVVASLRVRVSQVREHFCKLIDRTHLFLLSKLVSK